MGLLSPAWAAKAATDSGPKQWEIAKNCPGIGESAPALLASSNEPVTKNSPSGAWALSFCLSAFPLVVSREKCRRCGNLVGVAAAAAKAAKAAPVLCITGAVQTVVGLDGSRLAVERRRTRVFRLRATVQPLTLAVGRATILWTWRTVVGFGARASHAVAMVSQRVGEWAAISSPSSKESCEGFQ